MEPCNRSIVTQPAHRYDDPAHCQDGEGKPAKPLHGSPRFVVSASPGKGLWKEAAKQENDDGESRLKRALVEHARFPPAGLPTVHDKGLQDMRKAQHQREQEPCQRIAGTAKGNPEAEQQRHRREQEADDGVAHHIPGGKTRLCYRQRNRSFAARGVVCGNNRQYQRCTGFCLVNARPTTPVPV